jgi:glycosyltransferase involved in cell wall biosynthesis
VSQRRVLQVVHDFVPESMAGTEVNTAKLALDLHQRYGYEVRVFCRGWNLECEPYRLRDELVEGLPVRRVDFGRSGTRNTWRRRDARIEAAFCKTIDEFPPELVHVQHFKYLSTSLVALAAERGIPVVVSLRDFWFRCPAGTLLYHDDQLCPREPGTGCLSCLWPDRLGRRRRVLPWRLLNPTQRAVYQLLGDRAPLPGEVREIMPSLASWADDFHVALLRAAALHAPSRFLKEQLAAFGIPHERVTVVPNGVQLAPGLATDKSPSQKLRFAIVGTHRLKGLHVLIEAFRGLPQGAAELRVYGQVADQRYLAEQQQRAVGLEVTFRGTYRQDELSNVFRDIDVLIVPSIWYENCPTVIQEAFATRTPVVASNLGGMAEAVQAGVNGLLFAAGDPDDLRAKLKQLIGEPELVQALARGITPPLTQQQCTDRIVQLYQQAWQAPRASARGSAEQHAKVDS